MATFTAPIGQFLTQFDTAINTAQTTAVSGLVAIMQPPLISMAVIYFCLMGWRVASGDLERVNSFTFDMVKIGFILYLATNLTAFNKWVVGVFELGFPNQLSMAVMGGDTGTVGTVSGVGSAIDKIWAQMWVRAGTVWAQAGMLDVSSRIVAAASVLVGGLGLVLISGVYLVARFLFAIVVVLGPVAIGCAMFASTRPIFERWIGKGVSMIILQVAAIITLQIVMTGTQTFMETTGTAGDVPTQLQNLISMVIWIGLSAFAVYSLPALAYSIGTGVAISFAPIAAAALAAASAGLGSGSSSTSAAPVLTPPGGGDGGGAPDVNLSLARAELASPGAAPSGFSGGGSAAASEPPLLLPAPIPLLTYEGG